MITHPSLCLDLYQIEPVGQGASKRIPVRGERWSSGVWSERSCGRRGSYWGRFVERMAGVEIKPASFKFRNDQGHEVEFTAPYAKARIKRMQPLALDEYEFLRTITNLTAKITLPAPSTMHFYRCDDFADNVVYRDVDLFFADTSIHFLPTCLPCSSKTSVSSPLV